LPRRLSSGAPWIAYAYACAYALACACSFDSAGSTGDAASDDAGPAVDAAADAMGACPQPRQLRISVNGATEPLGTGQPFANVRLGDTVTLSAAGSCVQRGPINYEWQISPIDETRDSADPNLTSRDVQVYSMVKGRQYTVRLTITDGDGVSSTDLVYAFQVHGFEVLDGLLGGQDIDDLSFGGGYLWIASSKGGYRYDPIVGELVDLGATWLFTGADVFTNNIERVWYDPDADLIWIGHAASKTGLWRGDPALETFDYVRYDGATALNGATEVNDIGPAHPGVRIASNLGVTAAADSATFNGNLAPLTTVVEATGGTGTSDWMGGISLWSQADLWTALDSFGVGGDNKIRAIAMDGDNRLWVASDGFGVARVDGLSGETTEIYDQSTTGDLPHDQVRAIALDLTRDVWVATRAGIARRKADRGLWLTFAGAEGLADRLDVHAIAIDDATGDVYAGTTKGLVYIRLP